MKIAVSGKGGVGKTLVAGVLADFFVKKGFKVLAIDADPSPNLALTLGISLDEASKIVPVSENAQLLESKTRTGFAGVYRLSFSVDDIVEKFAVRSPYGVKLLVMGTVRSAGGGCTCPANAVIRALLQHLFVELDEVVIMDMEAGVEHMGRGTAGHVDIMLIVADPSLKSMDTAKKIYGLAAEAGIKKAFIIGNKIRNASESKLIQRFAADNKIPILDLVPHDEQILKADMQGETPLKYAQDSVGITNIQKIGEELLNIKDVKS
ncbi:MAG: protochlorophyllide reductase iron-sulfur ATP-binding protein [Candidatus Bathyarchaeota archaeon BA2]|nr:MAG: protochlorophyllide reductase iron-sulfur ATP-binding protein [Candidatus Bathyarchaeota archaeon BA2]